MQPFRIMLNYASGGAYPRTPLELFCFSISFEVVLPKKICLKNVEIMDPPLLKFLATPLVFVIRPYKILKKAAFSSAS